MELASSHGEGKFSLVPVYVSVACLYLVVSTMLGHSNADVIPFSPQEWMWAARDGYLDTMVAAYLKTGGMVADSSIAGSLELDVDGLIRMPFTEEEWRWALRDGYLGDILSSYIRHGGL